MDADLFLGSQRQFIEKLPHVPIYRTEKWIKENCRKAWDENVGYKPRLYEYWFSGRDSHRENLKMGYASQGGRFVREESINEECLRCFENENIASGNEKQHSYMDE